MSIARLICALGFFVEQNNYFGWNRFPQSGAELIADGIVFVLLALSFKEKSRP